MKRKAKSFFILLIVGVMIPLCLGIEMEAPETARRYRDHDTASNSERARTNAAKNQRSLQNESLVTVESDIPLEEAEQKTQEDEYLSSDILAMSSSLAETPLSKTESPKKTHFRLTNNGWEQRVSTTAEVPPEEWEPTDKWDPDPPDILWTYTDSSILQHSTLVCFIKGYNRADDIAKKKSLYEQELKSLNPSSDRAQFLKKIIPLFDGAIAYQNSIISRLQPKNEECQPIHFENKIDQRAAERKIALRESIRLESIMTINERPNQIERLIIQMEQDEKENPSTHQQPMQTEAVLIIEPNISTTSLLWTAEVNFYRALAQCSSLLGKICASRTGTKNRDNNDDASKTSQNTSLLLKHALSEAERDQPKQEAIVYYIRAATLNNAALEESDTENDPDRFEAGLHLNCACFFLFQAGKEFQKDQARQIIINYYLHLAKLHEEIAKALCNKLDTNRAERVRLFKEALIFYNKAALEAQTRTPDPALIENAQECESKARAFPTESSSYIIDSSTK